MKPSGVHAASPIRPPGPADARQLGRGAARGPARTSSRRRRRRRRSSRPGTGSPRRRPRSGRPAGLRPRRGAGRARAAPARSRCRRRRSRSAPRRSRALPLPQATSSTRQPACRSTVVAERVGDGLDQRRDGVEVAARPHLLLPALHLRQVGRGGHRRAEHRVDCIGRCMVISRASFVLSVDRTKVRLRPSPTASGRLPIFGRPCTYLRSGQNRDGGGGIRTHGGVVPRQRPTCADARASTTVIYRPVGREHPAREVEIEIKPAE